MYVKASYNIKVIDLSLVVFWFFCYFGLRLDFQYFVGFHVCI